MNVMATLTVPLPQTQVGWFEQMALSLGWTFQEDKSDGDIKDVTVLDNNDDLSPLVKHFKRGRPLLMTDEEIDTMRYEYLMDKYK